MHRSGPLPLNFEGPEQVFFFFFGGGGGGGGKNCQNASQGKPCA